MVSVNSIVLTIPVPVGNKFLKFKGDGLTFCTFSNQLITCNLSTLGSATRVSILWRLSGSLQASSSYVATLKGSNIKTTTYNAIIA